MIIGTFAFRKNAATFFGIKYFFYRSNIFNFYFFIEFLLCSSGACPSSTKVVLGISFLFDVSKRVGAAGISPIFWKRYFYF